MIEANKDRAAIIQQLREELVGPAPTGEPIAGPIRFETKEESYPPRRQPNGEEILQRTAPTLRYGVGVLYPFGTPQSDQGHPIAEGGVQEPEASEVPPEIQRDMDQANIAAQEELSHGGGEADDAELDLSTANAFEASSMAVSFSAELPLDGSLRVMVTGGRYESQDVVVAGKSVQWYLRRDLKAIVELPVDRLRVNRTSTIKERVISTDDTDLGPLNLQIEIVTRPTNDLSEGNLLTVALVNRTQLGGAKDLLCLFQARFEASIVTTHSDTHILPYPETPHHKLDAEEQGLALLYRTVQTFAVGHGCAADWESREGADRARSVSAECLPMVETPSVTPEIRRADGREVQVSMASLASLVDGDDGMEALNEVVTLYEDWIQARHGEISSLQARYQPAAERHLGECRVCATRMRDGLSYLADPTVWQAFQLANRSILLQQITTKLNREPRRAEYDAKELRITFVNSYPEIDAFDPPEGVGQWRPFQIAFLLMTLRSSVESRAPDRNTVELIWFPTGGGKTEAYLGLTAFSLFMRRLRDPNDTGVSVIMRYTLRLLTAQQFQRASALTAAMEIIRRQMPDKLGKTPFSIGIWLGQSTTPNTKQAARKVLHELQKGDSENKLLLRQCPWCGAQMGPLAASRARKRGRQLTVVLGYEEARQTVTFRCPDAQCPFNDGIPVYVVDEDIYQACPSVIIGTVDKFAMLAWRPEARTLFGLDSQGCRIKSPPSLVIQDELHLIAGPLGSMVGLYEPVIEDLCTDKRPTSPVPPKIVSSTATIRRYKEQIKALYGRQTVALFPPPGLDAGDSFFGRYARKHDGSRAPGRMYVGVNAPGLGSQLTTVVRSFTSLLQAPTILPAEGRDPWWTLMVFFNSLRELGTSLSLLQSDIPDYVVGMRNRMGRESAGMRFPRHILELTSRIRNDEVPRAIEQLEVKALNADPPPIDVCLASSIIEVGIDVDRLSLMAVVSQPKTTSQYIQVTGRVGRRWWERPGLIATIYSPSRPRDRSHFEKFRSYHERLYAQVEPTSVTPFSPPALARSLHAAMIAYVRQTGVENMVPIPFPEGLVDDFTQVMERRAKIVTDRDDQLKALDEWVSMRKKQWKDWEPRKWRPGADEHDPGLMYPAGEYVPPEWIHYTWPVQQSLRTVDAECQAVITRLYKNHSDTQV